MSHEEDFVRAIRVNPADETLRLVFADWLEEQGQDRNDAFCVTHAVLLEGSVAHRILQVAARDRKFVVECRLESLFLERLGIYVDGELCDISMRHGWHFPCSEFYFGGHKFKVKIRFWPWLTIRSVTLHVDDRLLYS